jgi:histidyl-tRNA synthetase
MRIIREEYARNGFTEIETSQIENLDNFENSDGGDNTKLIFKILKRGEKLENENLLIPKEFEMCRV